ncbi:hypothetical protein [uncultured Phocaeicola sp.]|jgi:hypothetical protein|uniref:hypothetical protein n=1 Tax=uncultured Phocaeicola sp. TaxID=990718 RepID=UPI0015AE9F8B|nr:hypothetical protein [uncultured Phocaeicola sp.]
MLERDYIKRLIRQFFDALEKLIEKKEYTPLETIQLEFEGMYRTYFHESKEFFRTQDSEYLLMYLCQTFDKQELLDWIEILSELLYQDALIQTVVAEQKSLLAKSLYLLEYLDQHSNTFSFERRGKIAEIKKKID